MLAAVLVPTYSLVSEKDELGIASARKKKCKGGKKRCGKKCVDLRTDRRNCSSCGHVCGYSQVCKGGICRAGCTVCASGCQFANVADAIEAAQADATIQIAPGTYEGDLVISKNLQLQRCGSSGEVRLRNVPKPPMTRTITIQSGATVTLENLTLTRTTIPGGEIEGGRPDNWGNTTAIACTFVDGRDDGGSGGAITNAGQLTLRGCDVTSNQGGDQGAGGILNLAGASLTLETCSIANNRGGAGTGGIHNKGSLQMTDCVFEGNQGSFGGGLLNKGDLQATACTIRDNIGGASGGGIYNYFGAARLTDCVISGNRALEGGGIMNSGFNSDLPPAILTLVAGCTVTGNSATWDGGGIFNQSMCSVIFKAGGANLIKDNTTRGSGGGLHNQGTQASVTFEAGGGSVIGNSAEKRGGGIYNSSASTVVFAANAGVVRNNTAGHDGGGIYNGPSSVVTLNGNPVTDNLPNNCAGETPVEGCVG